MEKELELLVLLINLNYNGGENTRRYSLFVKENETQEQAIERFLTRFEPPLTAEILSIKEINNGKNQR